MVEGGQLRPFEESDQKTASWAQSSSELRQCVAYVAGRSMDQRVPGQDAGGLAVVRAELFSACFTKTGQGKPGLCDRDELRHRVEALDVVPVRTQEVCPVSRSAADVENLAGA